MWMANISYNKNQISYPSPSTTLLLHQWYCEPPVKLVFNIIGETKHVILLNLQLHAHYTYCISTRSIIVTWVWISMIDDAMLMSRRFFSQNPLLNYSVMELSVLVVKFELEYLYTILICYFLEHTIFFYASLYWTLKCFVVKYHFWQPWSQA